MRPGSWRARACTLPGGSPGRVPVAELADAAGPVEFCLLAVCAHGRCAALFAGRRRGPAMTPPWPPRWPRCRRAARRAPRAGGAPDRAGWQNAPGLRGQRERGGGAGAGAGRAGHRHGRGPYRPPALPKTAVSTMWRSATSTAPQAVGSETVRYAGSLLSYSMDECAGGAAPAKKRRAGRHCPRRRDGGAAAAAPAARDAPPDRPAGRADRPPARVTGRRITSGPR